MRVEHVQNSVGVEMEAYGDDASLVRKQTGSPAVTNIEWYNCQGRTEVN